MLHVDFFYEALLCCRYYHSLRHVYYFSIVHQIFLPLLWLVYIIVYQDDLFLLYLLQGEFDPLLIESVNLQGCQFVTDWGIHWLAMLLKGKRGQTKVLF